MKALFAVASLLILTDITINNSLPAHSQRTEEVWVNEGNNSVEVYTEGDKADLSCTFTHISDQVVQEHTKHCAIKTGELTLPAHLHIKVVNNENHSITYTLHAQTILPIK